MGSDTKSQLLGCVPATSAVAFGCDQGDHGNAPQAGEDRLHLLRYGDAYVQQEEAVYSKQVQARLEKQLHRRAKELGYEVVKLEPPVANVEPPATATPA